MLRLPTGLICSFVSVLALVACSDDKDGAATNVKGEALAGEHAVAEQYAQNVHANYADCLATAQALKTAIDNFLAAPSKATQDAAKDAWKAAREPYRLSEGFRFYAGPIDDDATGPEPRLNSWPLDENFIDYTRDDPSAGIINHPEVELTKEAIAQENTHGGEKNISTGYHAIEFLLWGQDDIDVALKTPGQRSFTDYVEGGNAKNVDRRKTYLKLVTELLVDDLQRLVTAWEPGQENYAKSFLAEAQGAATTKMLVGIGSLANAELSGERMTVAYKTRDQEDEHSCFSDTTNADLLGNIVSIQDIYVGKYGSTDGAGIDDMVKVVDPALNDRMNSDLAAGVAALQAIQAVPFDFAIQQADGTPERDDILKAIQAVKKVAKTIEEVGQALGLALKVEQPSQEL